MTSKLKGIKAFATSVDPGQPAHSCSLIRQIIYYIVGYGVPLGPLQQIYWLKQWKYKSTMVKSLNNETTMVNIRKYDDEKSIAWWWKDENTKVRWWKLNIISCFHHRGIVILTFHYGTFTFQIFTCLFAAFMFYSDQAIGLLGANTLILLIKIE